MKEFNFFEQYLSDSKETREKKYRYFITIAVVIIAILYYPAYSYIAINDYNARIQDSQEYLDSSKNSREYKRIIAIDEMISSLEMQQEELLNVRNFLENSNSKIDDSLLLSITRAVPENVDIQLISVTEDIVSINGSSLDKNSISKFQTNLRKIIEFDSVFIPNIFYETKAYDFNIQLRISNNRDVSNQ